jgi:hypothetical protein
MTSGGYSASSFSPNLLSQTRKPAANIVLQAENAEI